MGKSAVPAAGRSRRETPGFASPPRGEFAIDGVWVSLVVQVPGGAPRRRVCPLHLVYAAGPLRGNGPMVRGRGGVKSYGAGHRTGASGAGQDVALVGEALRHGPPGRRVKTTDPAPGPIQDTGERPDRGDELAHGLAVDATGVEAVQRVEVGRQGGRERHVRGRMVRPTRRQVSLVDGGDCPAHEWTLLRRRRRAPTSCWTSAISSMLTPKTCPSWRSCEARGSYRPRSQL